MPADEIYAEANPKHQLIIDKIRASKYSMTSEARLWATALSVDHVCKNSIEGDFVECGVWRGGNSALANLIIKENNQTNSRNVYLFDTFEGMTAPTNEDKHEGINTQEWFERYQKETHNEWCYASLEDVKHTMSVMSCSSANVFYVKGPVEKTLIVPENLPKKISVLRLDTDWYESTKIELEVLYPLLESGGILMIDDYGYWEGARKAVDEYFASYTKKPFLFPIDTWGRIFVKP